MNMMICIYAETFNRRIIHLRFVYLCKIFDENESKSVTFTGIVKHSYTKCQGWAILIRYKCN